MPVVVTPIPVVLGGRTLTPLARYMREGFACDYALGGAPWLAAPRDDDPMTRTTTPYQRERVDQATTAGESSLSNWWLRSATDWSNGAGITFYDANEEDLGRFRDSFNIDVWTEGQITLLKATTQVTGLITGITDVANCDAGAWVLTSAGNLGRVSTAGSATANITASCTRLTTDGVNAYVSKSDGIYKVTPSNVVTKIYDKPAGAWTVQALEYVKDRLIVAAQVTDAKPMRLFEISRAPATVPTTISLTTDSRFEYESTDLSFSGITETTGAVLFGTNIGSKSKVYSMTIATTSDGNVTVLEPVVVAQLPTGELLRSMQSYLGTFVALGTSRGLRVATETQNGIGFSYGPLVFEDNVTGVYFNGDYLYATRNVLKGAVNGLWRVSLANEVDGSYAYAPDLSSSTSAVNACCPLGTTGRMLIAAGDSLWLESATDFAATGQLTSGAVRFGTTEKKQAVSVLSRLSGDVSGGVTFRLATQDGSFRDYSNFTTGETTDWSVSSQLLPSSSFEATIIMLRGTTTTAPVLEEWQLRALPAPQRSRTITIPFMCYPRETDALGNTVVTDAFDRLKVLELLESFGGAVLFQDFITGEERIVVVRAVEYKQVGPSSFKDGFGGVVTVQLQTVDTEI
jgi:hypothetical protein